MASDDYASAIGGGLKLKGSKPSGVTKKKKNKNKSKPDSDDSTAAALQKALADEERAAAAEKTEDVTREEQEEYEPGGGKTEAERKYEEMRRKRVRLYIPPSPLSTSHRITFHLSPTKKKKKEKNIQKTRMIEEQ